MNTQFVHYRALQFLYVGYKFVFPNICTHTQILNTLGDNDYKYMKIIYVHCSEEMNSSDPHS